MADKSWIAAITEVMEKAGKAMHYSDIAEEIVSQGLRKNVGSTPATIVNSYISSTIIKKGRNSVFLRVNRGEYILRRFSEPDPIKKSAAAKKREKEMTKRELAVGAFGMFWSRDKIIWSRNPRLFGRQQIGADPVDFSGQIGVYLLHDGRSVIYVGRSTDRPLGLRLFEHTQDRLSGRWDRFSWFGLLAVTETGKLEATKFYADIESWIQVMEGLLIETLEPPQNRKRGDDFSGIEYLQAIDPELEKQKKLQLMSELEAMLNNK